MARHRAITGTREAGGHHVIGEDPALRQGILQQRGALTAWTGERMGMVKRIEGLCMDIFLSEALSKTVP